MRKGLGVVVAVVLALALVLAAFLAAAVWWLYAAVPTPVVREVPAAGTAVAQGGEVAKLRAQLDERDAELARLRGRLAEAEARASAAAGKPARSSRRSASGSNIMSRTGPLHIGGVSPNMGELPFGLDELLPSMIEKALKPRDPGRLYGDFTRASGLGTADAARLDALLAARDGVRASNMMITVGDHDPLPEAPALARNSAALKELLGEDGFARLQAYETSLPAREAVVDLEDRFQGAGVALSEGQRASMIELFGQSEMGTPGVETLTVVTGPGESLEDAANREVESSIGRWNAVEEGARKTLSPEQYKVFDEYLGERLAAREEQAKMVGEMTSKLGVELPEGVQPGQIHVISTTRSFSSGVQTAEPTP